MVAAAGWWGLSWLSPGAAWFIFFNIVVGAIAVMSRSRSQAAGHARSLSRSASSVVLDRLRSVSLFSFRYSDVYMPPLDQAAIPEYDSAAQPGNSAQEPPEEEAPSCRVSEGRQQSSEASSAAAERVYNKSPSTAADAPTQQEEEPNNSISLEEAYVLARRGHASSAARRRDEATVLKATREEPRGHDEQSRSSGGKEELNARADDFIKQFREQLKLQRINSLLNYRSMLHRGT